MLKFIQINLGHGREAQDLMIQKAVECCADVVIISEPYKKPSSSIWYQDPSNRAAILICNKKLHISEICEENAGFVYVTLNGIRIYSCYYSPNLEFTSFAENLHSLDMSIRNARREVIVGGDFNSKSPEWNSRTLDRRGNLVGELIATNGLITYNTGESATFRRGESQSIIDITFGNPEFQHEDMNWSVLEDLTLSDHQYIAFNVHRNCTAVETEINFPRWNAKRLDANKFKNSLLDAKRRRDISLENPNAGELVKFTMKTITKCCNVSMPKIKEYRGKQPLYWWTTEIGQLRSKCLSARRASTRNHGDPTLKEEFKNARKSLRSAIKMSKRERWLELCEKVDLDPWGKPYKIVTKNIGIRKPIPGIREPTWATEIVTALFPMDEEALHGRRELESNENYVPFNGDELKRACSKLKTGKSPGPDGIPNEVLKLTGVLWPEILLMTFNKCLETGVFPKSWKEQKLVLLRKGDKPLNETSSYRPLCMLDTTSKLFECLLLKRLEDEMERHGGFSSQQYGFRKGKSTIDAINDVMEIASTAKRKLEFCAIITLDVRNAFNTVKWNAVLEALREKGIDPYLYNVIQQYLCERVLLYETENGLMNYNVTAGVPQGSVLGPFLWNVMYDGLLNMKLQEGAKLVGFADDIALVISQPIPELIEIVGNDCLGRCDRWLNKHGLELAAAKTEAILVTDRRVFDMPKMRLRNNIVTFSRSLRYLGVQIDSKLKFKEHVEIVRDKALRTARNLARIMPNIRGPKDSTRRLINSVVHSQLLYAAPVFVKQVKIKDRTTQLTKPQRISALRVISAYRTVSTSAALVLAGIPPVDLLVVEREEIWRKTKTKLQARESLMRTWQDRWERDERGRWTYKLIPNIQKWMERKHGRIHYYMTQIMTGHGSFNSYLHRFKIKESDNCENCGAGDDSAEHNLFQCPRWDRLRQDLNLKLGMTLNPQNIVDTMIDSKDAWNYCDTFICRIMKERCQRTPNS